MKTRLRNKQRLKNWARNCHFDGCIAIKEIKGKKWMAVLRWLEANFDFDIDDYNSINDQWEVILKNLNKLTHDQVNHIDGIRFGL